MLKMLRLTTAVASRPAHCITWPIEELQNEVVFLNRKVAKRVLLKVFLLGACESFFKGLEDPIMPGRWEDTEPIGFVY